MAVRVYKVNTKDFTEPFSLVCELKDGGHSDGINQIDISPGKSLLLSAGNDACACVWDLRKRTLSNKLTFRDKNFRNRLGQATTDDFMIRGGLFTNCGQYVYLLAAKPKYGSFLVKFGISP